MTTTETRALWQIARDIRADWPMPYVGAKPYIRAMTALDTIDEAHSAGTGRDVVRLFLVNAGSWRGDTAREIKAELRALLDQR